MKAFNVSKNLVDYARKHAKEIGSGITAEIKPIIRERIDPLKVEFFLDFICQGNYLQDVAYGHRLLKITDNYSISIPNVVRTANNSKIVNDYMIICKQLNMIPLSKSVCFKILKECSASFSKSLKGLDNMYADGLDAFDKLEDLFQLCSNIDQMNNLRCVLKTSKNYLKFEIKSHLSYSNECADHCASYALSDDKENLCDHQHTRSCKECNLLDYLLMSQKEEIEKLNENQKKEILYDFELQATKIKNWKNHIIRNWCQDQIKYLVLNNFLLAPDTIYYHCDWAMKFLPTMYREKQEDWFGKRGISWHVAVVVYYEENCYKTLKFIHSFSSVSQDSDAVIGITDSVFREVLAKLGPRKIYFRSDNAGCYHSSSLICILPYLASKYSHKMVRFDFCEPQKGKDICDRIIAQIKRYLLAYIDQGNNIINANDIKKAVDSISKLEGLICYVCDLMNNIDFKKDFNIKNISYLHSFEYFEDYLIAYKYYNVGTGNKIMYKDLTKLDSKDIKNKIENFSLKIHDSNEMNDFGNLKSKSNNLSLIKCKFDGCNYSTSDKNEIKEHNGSHELHLNQHSKIKLKYAEKVSDMRTNNLLIESAYKNDNENSIMNSIYDLKKGFALRKIERKRLNENQKRYILEKFNIGENTGRKVDPKACEKEMISLTERFSNEERLSYKTIQSQFYQLKIKKSKNINLEINSDTNSNSDNEKSIKIKKTAKKVIKIINSDSSDTS